MTPATAPKEEFDAFAGDYDAALQEGLDLSGENKEYFAGGRIRFLGRCLERAGVRPRSAMDYGCGTGSAVPFLRAELGVTSVVGVDVSRKSLEVARRLHGAEGARFATIAEFSPQGDIDLAFCNGVFHHIPPAARAGAAAYVATCLRPGGLFALWENNPWNPGARLVMRRISFDRDAIMLSAPEARRLLREAGLEVLRTDFLFIFPRILSALRRWEPRLSRLPLGAQYQVLARRPR